jgi:hypothetical protein
MGGYKGYPSPSRTPIAVPLHFDSYLLDLFPPDTLSSETQSDREAVAALMAQLHPQVTPQPLIRLGPPDDGGYVLPDDLAGIDVCFSPGVSTVSGFEKDCAELGMEIFMADYSVAGPALEHPKFHFIKKFIGPKPSANFITLDDWVADTFAQYPDLGRSDVLLQIDVEGYEYAVFLAASDRLMSQCRLIVGEFHQLELLWHPDFLALAQRAFEKILKTHTCVHSHPNNYACVLEKDGLVIPEVMEFTFLRKDRMTAGQYQTTFPHPLDGDNTAENPPLVLPDGWFRRP